MISLLLVEDDEDLGDLLQELFAQVGWLVRIERNGADALKYLESALPDIILTDGMMPGMSGLEFMTRLRAEDRLRQVPVVLVSGSDSLLQQEAEAALFQATVRKPFDSDALVNLVLKLARPSEGSPAPTGPRHPEF